MTLPKDVVYAKQRQSRNVFYFDEVEKAINHSVCRCNPFQSKSNEKTICQPNRVKHENIDFSSVLLRLSELRSNGVFDSILE